VINDQLLRTIATLRQVPLNVVDLRSAVALLTGVCALDSSHALAGRTGWTIWATAEVSANDDRIETYSPAQISLAEPGWFSRRSLSEATLQDQIIDAVLTKSSKEGGFALIHEVRSLVCHRHRIHSHFFNEMLSKMHRAEITHPAYRPFLDRGGAADLPPSESPFIIGDRDFYIIKFIPIKENHYGAPDQIYS
jgi:hypothetical protein